MYCSFLKWFRAAGPFHVALVVFISDLLPISLFFGFFILPSGINAEQGQWYYVVVLLALGAIFGIDFLTMLIFNKNTQHKFAMRVAGTFAVVPILSILFIILLAESWRSDVDWQLNNAFGFVMFDQTILERYSQ